MPRPLDMPETAAGGEVRRYRVYLTYAGPIESAGSQVELRSERVVSSSVVTSDSVLQDRYLVVRGLRIRYRASGSGDPVLLLHGLGASLEQWEWTQPGLSKNHQVVALDLPGFGLSQSPPREQFDLDGVVSLLDGFIYEMGWQFATVIGNSMGGLLALSMALNLGGRVSRLVLAGSAGLGREVGRLLRLARIPWLGELLLLPMGLHPVAGYSLRRLFSDPSRLPPSLVDVTCRHYRRRPVRDNLLNAARIGVSLQGQVDAINFRGQLDKIDVPTLLIWGSEDGVIPLEHGKVAHKLIAGSNLTIIDDCGHVPQLEHPDRFVEEVERFLARSSP